MEKQIELLAPGGDIDSIKAAIAGGADAIYCGLAQFNARNRASNISFEELKAVIRVAHKNDCEVFLTLNIIILENEIPALISLLNKLVNINLDGIIVQDIGLMYIISKWFRSLPIHASTQMTTHNVGQIKFLNLFNVERANLCRELNLDEIIELTRAAQNHKMQTEVFIHGSNCICFSGICYMSSVTRGNSGNRGKCSQPCRDKYLTTPVGFDYPLNLKDNCAFDHIKELMDAGVYSLKIEGRIKKYDYIYPVVNTYKKQIQYLSGMHNIPQNKDVLYKVFNRDLSNGYLTNHISKDMFIDNPRDHSVKRIKEQNNNAVSEITELAEKRLYEEKEQIKDEAKNKIDILSMAQIPLDIKFQGKEGAPLRIIAGIPDKLIKIESKIALGNKGSEALSYGMIIKRVKTIDDTDYVIRNIDLTELEGKVYLPYKELTLLRNRLKQELPGYIKKVSPITPPQIKNTAAEVKNAGLSVVVSSIEDVPSYNNKSNLYFKLPSSLKTYFSEYVRLFTENRNLIPWFPSVIIGEDYTLARDFIDKIKPHTLVSDNTGIAYEAFERKIKWIAGPFLNMTNSYALQSLYESFNCMGAFVSGEINKQAIINLKKPEGFKLFYSIYNPIQLMTTRQCLFQQIGGCEKKSLDQHCISHCEQLQMITNTRKASFVAEKSKGNYHRLYESINHLNLEVIQDFRGKFDEYFIDLSDVGTQTKPAALKREIILLFELLLSGDVGATEKIEKVLGPTANLQYTRKRSI
ncbi:peptidase U32 family protein [Plebeiibacterium marinum]|uniref:U32 family peptidase n=1 Tax=Plebeiibacterium marinum TaxID=2992111 RepID=A0AAE3MIU7_9BACT|nr:peptidase U32 family protein [Plebeiobacterium marinum]MCW3807872.1 U32 family peptidase [Plebeiobacterium marinum]